MMVMPFIVSMCTNSLSGIMIDEATVVLQSSNSSYHHCEYNSISPEVYMKYCLSAIVHT
jgi:hypothetical protein